MAIKQQIKFKDEINFEADQQDLMKNMNNIQSLADQVEKLEGYASDIEMAEKKLNNVPPGIVVDGGIIDFNERYNEQNLRDLFEALPKMQIDLEVECR